MFTARNRSPLVPSTVAGGDCNAISLRPRRARAIVGGVAPFLPQPCFRASAQERQAGPIGASLDKAIVIIEAGGIVGITQQCPFDELLGRRIVNGGRKSRCITKLVLLHQLE